MLVAALWGVAAGVARAEDVPRSLLRVMTYNLWHGGDAGGQPLARSAAVITAAEADIVGLQETQGNAAQGPRPDNARLLSQRLGWHYFDQGDRTGIISRYPLAGGTPRKWGVAVELPLGRRVFVFNAHLNHAPYQPYQLVNIPYHEAPFLKTEAEAVAAAREARGEQTARLLGELRVALLSGLPVFLTGDFNEPSHLDWTERAAQAGHVPLKVEFPTSQALAAAGLVDCFRADRPDETRQRGNTWTPIKAEDDPAERHDRIDFVYFAGQGAALSGVHVVGEDAAHADIVVRPYPSDHRAVVATFSLR